MGIGMVVYTHGMREELRYGRKRRIHGIRLQNAVITLIALYISTIILSTSCPSHAHSNGVGELLNLAFVIYTSYPVILEG